MGSAALRRLSILLALSSTHCGGVPADLSTSYEGPSGSGTSAAAQPAGTLRLPHVVGELASALEPRRDADELDPHRFCADASRARGSVRPVALFDRSSSRWLVADVDWEPGEGHSISWVGFASRAGDVPIDEREASDRTWCTVLRSHPGFETVPNLIDASALECHAASCASSLVRAGSWLLYYDTSSVADDVLHAFRPGGGAHWVVARRAAAIGAFDAGACASDPDGVSCTPVRTYVGISAIRRAPDGSSMLVQGYRGPPDHRHAGPFHWVVQPTPPTGPGP